jgi:two-component system sensor histidine kinase HydH
VEVAEVPASNLECDEVLLGQALGNLIANAIEAPGRQHPVRVTVALENEPDAFVRIEITDDGQGVAEGDRSRLFTPFFTTRAQGTGLGLAEVQRIVDGHGGRVTAGAASGGGARFVVRLPGAPAADPR